jgi:signal peptidase
MTGKMRGRDFRSIIATFRVSDHPAISLIRDLIWIAAAVGGIILALYLICGTWPAVVAIESKSMDPHMKVGDLVVVVQKDRYGAFQTWLDGSVSNYTRYGEYGDVIIYKPNGLTTITPIIHRAIQYVDTGPVTEIKDYQLPTNYTPVHPGYITWGDNNPYPDQFSSLGRVGALEPVKDEWIVGKALFAVPLIGYLPLNIWVVAIVAFIVMILYELSFRLKENKKPARK